eukprot:6180825-Pleurochrysis_carterae.AAC.1
MAACPVSCMLYFDVTLDGWRVERLSVVEMHPSSANVTVLSIKLPNPLPLATAATAYAAAEADWQHSMRLVIYILRGPSLASNNLARARGVDDSKHSHTKTHSAFLLGWALDTHTAYNYG